MLPDSYNVWHSYYLNNGVELSVDRSDMLRFEKLLLLAESRGKAGSLRGCNIQAWNESKLSLWLLVFPLSRT